MNYKKLFKSQQVRFAILKMLSWAPDRVMLQIQYRIKLGRWMDLKNPKRFTEKLQLYKMKYRNPILGQCVDKYGVRQFVESKGLGRILNNCYGVYDDASQIDFSQLPDRFVVKSTDGGGGHNIFICRDKSQIDISQVVAEANSWLNIKDINPGREWAYTQISKSRIIVEEYLENEENPKAGISDYKFFCFDGKPYCVVYDGDRYIGHKRNFYNLNWENLNILSDCPEIEDNIEKPEGLDEMIIAASELSQGFPFVRVDLYYVKRRVFFGEMTFYPWSAYVQFSPDYFDFELGRQFDVSQFTN